MSPRPSATHIQRHPCDEIHPCYPTTIGVSGSLS
jgi:hypothetical protein